MAVYAGEIRLFAGRTIPYGWMLCDGSSLPQNQSQYATLYAAIGTTYGSTAPGNFSVPDLRGRVPIHVGSGFPLAISGGAEKVSLTVAQIPAHGHALNATDTTATLPGPQDNLPAQSLRFDGYQASVPGPQQMSPDSIADFGSYSPHNNLQPFQCLNFIICVDPANQPAPP
jgi:microcystin-dependent protein